MKNSGLFKTVHLCLLVLLILGNAFAAVMFIGGFGFDLTGVDRLNLAMRGVFDLINVLAFLIAILYLLNEYKKSAAVYYKTFMLFQVIETVFLIVLEFCFSHMSVVMVTSLMILAVKVFVLLGIVFLKDLGKQNTFVLFFVLLALEVIGALLTFFRLPQGMALYGVISVISRLMLCASIGLAIRGKYADKQSRGRKV